MSRLFKSGDIVAESLVRDYVQDLIEAYGVSSLRELKNLTAKQLGLTTLQSIATLGGIDYLLSRLGETPAANTSNNLFFLISINIALK